MCSAGKMSIRWQKYGSKNGQFFHFKKSVFTEVFTLSKYPNSQNYPCLSKRLSHCSLRLSHCYLLFPNALSAPPSLFFTLQGERLTSTLNSAMSVSHLKPSSERLKTELNSTCMSRPLTFHTHFCSFKELSCSFVHSFTFSNSHLRPYMGPSGKIFHSLTNHSISLGHPTFSTKPRKGLSKLVLSWSPYFLSTSSICQTLTSSTD